MEIFVSEKEKLVTYPLGATVKSLEQHDRELLEELEVYKRALTKCMDYADMLRRNSGSVNWYPDESDFYDQARKELEDEEK